MHVDVAKHHMQDQKEEHTDNIVMGESSDLQGLTSWETFRIVSK